MRQIASISIFIFAACVLFTDLLWAADGTLEKVVVLSRHGVRSPTQSEKILGLWSEKPWPVWPVGRGELTPRGGRLVTAMWQSLSERLKKSTILPPGMCPRQSDIYIRADVDERTRATAAAILEGLAPGCRLGYAVEQEKIDPLFHPAKAGLYRFDPIRVATDVLGMTRGGLESLQDDFSGILELLGNISGPPAPSLCSRFALMPKCQLSDLPNAVSISPDGDSVRIVGSLGVASSLAEIFLLEYGEWPDAPAGWGEVDQRVLSQALPVHSKMLDVVNRAPILAWVNGSALLREMTQALVCEHEDRRLNEASLVIFVGHDTNIANIASLLSFTWQAGGYPQNGIPPAGALFLELWDISGEKVVKARFFAQTPAALHAPFMHDLKMSVHAPKEAPVFSESLEQVAMSVDVFKDLVQKSTQGAPEVPVKMLPLTFGAPMLRQTEGNAQSVSH